MKSTKSQATGSQKLQAAIQSEASQAPERGTLTSEDLKVLRRPFPKDRLGVKVQSLNKDRTRAMLVLYLQHTDVQDRLEEVDPAWACEVISEHDKGDTVYVRSRITVKGVARENVGEGGDPKAAYSDALKRCAMLFGVGRYLYDSPTVWTDYNESRDRYRSWKVEDFEQALRKIDKSASVPSPESEAAAAASPPTPAAGAKPGLTTGKGGAKAKASSSGKARPREELNRILMGLYRPYLAQFPETQFSQLLQSRYGVAETRLMTVEQLEDLVEYLEERLRSVA